MNNHKKSIETETESPDYASPEKELWSAVFIQAVQDATGSPQSRANADRFSAQSWILSDEEFPNSFQGLCRLFGLCPIKTRTKLIAQFR